jgi:hypothetical protein
MTLTSTPSFAGTSEVARNSGAGTAGSYGQSRLTPLWFSWDTDLVHFVAVNSEVWDGPNMTAAPGNGSCVWNPVTKAALKVRKAPRWPRSWANFSLP